MSLLHTIKSIRILPTARAIQRLEKEGFILFSGETRLRARGRIGAGRVNSKIIRQIASPAIMKDPTFRNLALNLDRIDLEKVSAGLKDKSAVSRTKWLAEKIKSAKSSRRLGEILEQAGISRDEIEMGLAKEFRAKLHGLARKTVKLKRKPARKLVQRAARDFIELANLSEPGDKEFIGFIISILIRASMLHHASLPVHYAAVVFYSTAIAVEQGLFDDPAYKDIFQWLKTACLLHDIGKIAMPRKYHEERHPSDLDLLIIREHLPITVDLLSPIKWLKNVVPIIQHHHHHVRGYRDWLYQGLEKLSPAMRMCVDISNVADAADGMTSRRPYKKRDEKYEQMRDGKSYTQKIYTHEEAMALLKEWGWDAGTLNKLKAVLEHGQKYVLGLKKYFERNELKLAWFGIEHIIKKTILPFKGQSVELRADRLVLVDHRVLLWMINGCEPGSRDAVRFVGEVRDEMGQAARTREVGEEFRGLFRRLSNSEDFILVGILSVVLYRALKVDEKRGSDTFPKLIELSNRLIDDPAGLKEMVESFNLDRDNYLDQKLEWIVLKLYGEDGRDVPKIGSKAFIEQVDSLYGAAGLG